MAAALCITDMAHAQARTIEGSVGRVRDVDTIVVAGTPVRLNGVDGPELDTAAGRGGRAFLQRVLRGKAVRCDLNGERTHDRWIGICYVDGQDIGAIVIANGHALDCRRYSGGRYSSYETPASRSRLPRASYC
jgi:endonuclease YncB( thermonuclease family)